MAAEEAVSFAKIRDEANGIINQTVSNVVGKGSVGEEIDYDPKMVSPINF